LFLHQKNSKASIVLWAIVMLLAATSTRVLSSQTIQKSKPSAEKIIPLVGRVLAWKSPLVIGAGVGPQYEAFVFAAEADRGVSSTPTKIYYAFFQSDGLLPDSFVDYSKRYELQVVRDTRCDGTLRNFSYDKSTDDASGKPLPPLYVLRFLDGAPKDALKPDSILACYILRPGRYRILNQNTGKDDRTPPTH